MRAFFITPFALRPNWASAKDDDAEAGNGKACLMKVVMTGSADDGRDWQPHIRNTSPDLLEEAVKSVLQQADLLCADCSDTVV